MQTRYFIAQTNDLDAAHDGELYLNPEVANHLCGNLISNTRRPWMVWKCLVTLPPSEPDTRRPIANPDSLMRGFRTLSET